MSATIQIAGLGNYLEAFTKLQQRTSRQPEWLRALREDAFGRFCDAGFPTTRDEDWRFTNVAPIAQATFYPAKDGSAGVRIEDLEPFLLSSALCRMVFVNGRYAPELSDTEQLAEGVEAGSLAGRNSQISEKLWKRTWAVILKRRATLSAASILHFLKTARCLLRPAWHRAGSPHPSAICVDCIG